MSPSAIIAIIRGALEAVPLIAKELQNLRNAIELGRNAQEERERQAILARLNTLSSRLETIEDENEMASIIRSINRLGD